MSGRAYRRTGAGTHHYFNCSIDMVQIFLLPCGERANHRFPSDRDRPNRIWGGQSVPAHTTVQTANQTLERPKTTRKHALTHIQTITKIVPRSSFSFAESHFALAFVKTVYQRVESSEFEATDCNDSHCTTAGPSISSNSESESSIPVLCKSVESSFAIAASLSVKSFEWSKAACFERPRVCA